PVGGRISMKATVWSSALSLCEGKSPRKIVAKGLFASQAMEVVGRPLVRHFMWRDDWTQRAGGSSPGGGFRTAFDRASARSVFLPPSRPPCAQAQDNRRLPDEGQGGRCSALTWW